MTIDHQVVTDEAGNRIAAQIPWDQFEAIQDRLADEPEVSQEWSDELTQRAEDIDAGRVELIDGDDFLKRLEAV